MLTKDAFNALLKLIEEPPKHTIFVLCTTDAEKIPDTVLSRLVRVDFRKGGKEELKKSLEKVIIGEEIKIENEALEFILEKSDGSFRNLHRIFNEMVLSLGKELSFGQVESFYIQKSGSYTEENFETDLAKKEVKIILEKLGHYVPFWDRRIEILIATHPDSDHIHGLTAVLENYRVEKVLDNGNEADSQIFKKYEKLLAERRVSRETAETGMNIKLEKRI
jgi:DNA polymerase III delta prime subunit